MDTTSYDVVVIGGRPAGLAAGIALSRSRRSVIVLDARHPRNAAADGVHNFLTRDGTPPAELRSLARAEFRGYGGELIDADLVAKDTARAAAQRSRIGATA